MYSFYTNIFLGVIMILGAISLRYLVPWLKLKVNAEQFDNMLYWANIFIRAAEELFKGLAKTGPEKHDLVRKLLKENFEGMTDNEIDIIIKALVHEMNESKYKILE